ncbi:mycothiol synthase [Brachybacterium hainanense]|uniref:Mycothiol acetyltransferase n=1 Tax=Brachybacterium hainanense TaxID=1541174 RepID=A0ABV6RAD9_9MICO
MIITDRLTPAMRDAVLRLQDDAVHHDEVGPLDEAALLALEHALAEPSDRAEEPRPRHLLAPADGPAGEAGSSLLGYASILPDGTVQGMVDPAHRRRGIGSALLEAALRERPDAAVWAHGGLTAALALLSAHGLEPVRTLLTLGRPLAGPALVEEPASLAPLDLTTFEAARDGEDWVALNAVAFADHPEQGRMTLADLRERVAQPWFRPDGFFLARHLDELVGFVWTKHEAGSEDGEIYAVGTAPSAQGHGVARLLMVRALAHLSAIGARRAVLYVEGDNAPALSVYRRLGFTTIGRDVQLRRGSLA